MTVQYVDPFGPPWKFQWIRLIFAWKGGIFQNFWLEWVIAVAFCAVAICLVYYLTRENTGYEVPETLETLAEVVAFIGRRFQAAIGMMLAFYNSIMYGRWNAVRLMEGTAMRKINDIALRIAWTIKEIEDEDEMEDEDTKKKEKTAEKDDNKQERRRRGQPVPTRRIKTELVRLVNLSHAMVVGQLYEKRDNEFSTLDKLLDCGLVATKEECNFLKAQKTEFNFVAPLVWFQDIVRRLLTEEPSLGMDLSVVNVQFAVLILELRGALADLYMFKNQPIPLIYRQLVNVSVRLYLLMLLLDGIFWDLRKDSTSGGLTTGAFWEILKFAFEYFLFVGWLTASDAIGNPFRCWSDELEWVHFVQRISESSLSIALVYGERPPINFRNDDNDHKEPNTRFLQTCNMWQQPHEQQYQQQQQRRQRTRNNTSPSSLSNNSAEQSSKRDSRGEKTRKVLTGF